MVNAIKEKILELQNQISDAHRDGHIKQDVYLSQGHHRIAAMVCSALEQDDTVVGNHRSQGTYIAKGGNVARLLDELSGLESGCSKGVGGSTHLCDEAVGFLGSTDILAASIPVAVGLAFSYKMKQIPRVSCTFFGDAALEQGVFYESLNFAVVHNLPVLFVCENNDLAISTRLNRRQRVRKGSVCSKVSALGIETHKLCQRMDAEKTKQIVEKIRLGSGPVFVEFRTKLMKEHEGHIWSRASRL